MQITKLIFSRVTISLLLILGACSNNEHEDYSHEHHEDMSHASSLEEENHSEMEREKSIHKEHDAIQDKFAHQDIIILDIPYQLEKAEKEKFQQIIEAYLNMKNLLVVDDLEKIDNSISVMKEKVNSVSWQLFKDGGKKAWKQHAELYNTKLDEMAHVEGLEEKRSYFNHISEIVYCSIKSFDLADEQKLYTAFCPMAFNGKGAYWISETKEIKNPYFGKMMLTCGNIKEKL